MQVKIHLSGLLNFPIGGFSLLYSIISCEIVWLYSKKNIQRKVNKPTFQSYCNIVRAVAIGMRGAKKI